jgi:general secretion pathway protein D
LKDIPVIGAFFRSESKNRQRVELIAMIRPTVLPTPESAAITAAAEKDRLPGVKAAERDNLREDEQRRRALENDGFFKSTP